MREYRKVVINHAVVGLALAAAVAAILGGPVYVLLLVKAYPAQVVAGVAGVIAVASVGASKVELVRGCRVRWLHAIGLTFGAFLSGAVAALVVNLQVFGNLQSASDWRSYVWLPLAWLALFGIPCALGIGAFLGVSLLAKAARLSEEG